MFDICRVRPSLPARHSITYSVGGVTENINQLIKILQLLPSLYLGLNVFSCSFSSRSFTSLSWVDISFSASESLFRVFSNSWKYILVPGSKSLNINTWRTVEFSFFASSRLILKLTSSQSVFFLDLLTNNWVRTWGQLRPIHTTSHLSISSTNPRNLEVSSSSCVSFVGSENSDMERAGSEERTTLNLFLQNNYS